MDSPNSGSMQSSSGGDEEYDSSRVDSFSAFFNSSISTPPPPPLPPHNPAPLFDPQPNYFTSYPNPTTPHSLLNLDMLWSDKTLAPHSQQPNYTTNIPPLMGSSSSQSPSLQTPVRPSSSTSDQTRPSKKRSRASRRAPTTVLTTDTSNFRAMVQEFTGIPAPPFAARTRFDLFNPRPTPPYLLRPFAQKVQPSPYGLPSSSSSNILGSLVNASSNPISNSSNNSYQLLSELGFPKQSQNPSLSFQSLLQSTPKYTLPNPPILSTKPMTDSNPSNPTMGLLQEFNMNQGNGTSQGTEFSNLEDMIPRNAGNWDDQLRTFNGEYDNSQHVNNCNKMNPSSDFQVEKAMENAPPRSGEGMVDSWICSSD